MARYGIDYYGVGSYGAGSVAFVDFDASPFVAKSVGYQRIELTWTPPTGDWSRIRLIRNTYGFPLSVDDGTTVLDEPKNFSTGYFIDEGSIPAGIGLKPASGYHYSLFVLDTQSGIWIKAGDAFAVSSKDFNSLARMSDALPAVYKINNLATITDNSTNPDLEKFLRIFAVDYDQCKTTANLLLNTYDTSVAYAPIIPVMMQQFGIAYEPELGLQQSRILLRNAVYINKSKGSFEGLTNFVKAFTGYDESTTLGKNLMLDFNDSSFEESIGRWTVALGTGTLAVARASEVAAYSEPTLVDFPNKTTGVLKITKTLTTGSIEVACGISAPKTRAVPIKEGSSYTFSLRTRAAATARVVTVGIIWYDRNNEELSRAGENFATNNSTNWSTRVSSTGVAPLNAYFAVPYLRIDAVPANEIHYVDAAQLELSSEGPTSFEEARDVKITLKASRVNEFKNPSFEVDTTFWSIDNATMTRDVVIKDEANNSDVSLRIQADSTDEVVLSYTDLAPVLPGFWYSASGYVRTAFIGDKEDDLLGGWGVNWYDANEILIDEVETKSDPENLTEFYSVTNYSRTNGILTVSTTDITSLIVGQDVRLLGFTDATLNGDYEVLVVSGRFFQVSSIGENLNATAGTVNSLVQDLKLDFVRNSYSVLSPANASYAKPYFFWSNPEEDQILHIDSTMFERATIAKPYFDGSVGFSSAEDLIWEDGVHSSRSHYYKNRVATQIRLIDQLPNYLTAGTTFSVFLAQPGL
jgi:hypothetical protein